MKLIDAVVEKYPIGTWPAGMLAVGPMYTFNAFVGRKIKDDEYVTREQYEAALADSKPEWDGEGLPPVGSKVSFFYNDRYNYNEEIIPQDGQELEVVAHKTTTDENEVAVCYWDEDGGGMAVCLVPGSLRPIRSEADKKRDEIIEALKEGLGHAHGLYDLMQIYHLLNNGKIPHIRID